MYKKTKSSEQSDNKYWLWYQFLESYLQKQLEGPDFQHRPLPVTATFSEQFKSLLCT